jgi:hypothetical protein
MTPNTNNSRTSIALTKETIANIKEIASHANVKMYQLIDAAIEVMVNDDDIRDNIVGRAVEKIVAEKIKKTNLARRVKELPEELQNKLKAMSDKELEELLNKALSNK